MALTADQIYLLNTKMGKVGETVQLGTLLNSAFTVAPGELTLASAHLLVGNGSNVGADVAVSGDLTLANTGAFTIANSAVTNAKVSASAAIAFSKLAALSSGNILVGNVSNVAASVAMTGDVTIDNTGATTLGAGKVTVAQLGTATLTETTVALTQANITAMNGAAVNLLPAPGAGKVIVIQDIEFFHLFATAAYTNGGVVAIQYTGSTVITKAAAAIVTAAASETWYQRPTLMDLDNTTGTGKGLSTAGLANLGVEITNATAAFAAGNASNVLKIRFRYRIVTLQT